MSLKLLTTEEVCELLRVSPGMVTRYIKQGKLTAINIGSGKKRPLYRFTQTALDNYLAGQTTLVAEKPTRKPSRSRRKIIEYV